MRIAVAHLSDIHIRSRSNPVADRLDQIVSAIDSSDPNAGLFLMVISGDIAFSGDQEEYTLALEFFDDIKRKLKERRPDAEIRYFCVPGNHDCVLPESDKNLREVLINGLLPTLREPAPDMAVLGQVLRVQDSYKNFAKTLTLSDGTWDGVCQTVFVEHQKKKIQLNLYNTAMLSRREERQAELSCQRRCFAPKLRWQKRPRFAFRYFTTRICGSKPMSQLTSVIT
jgi:hypothetical protein